MLFTGKAINWFLSWIKKNVQISNHQKRNILSSSSVTSDTEVDETKVGNQYNSTKLNYINMTAFETWQ